MPAAVKASTTALPDSDDEPEWDTTPLGFNMWWTDLDRLTVPTAPTTPTADRSDMDIGMGHGCGHGVDMGMGMKTEIGIYSWT